MKTEESVIENKYYTSITELPLHSYVDCLIKNNLSHLIISGSPSPDNLAIAWSDITQEYVDAIGNSGFEMYLMLAKELALLEVRLCLVENCVAILKCVYEKKYADKVNEILHTNFVFDYNDQDKYQELLDRCLVRSKSIFIQITLKRAQLEGQDARFKSDSKAPTREYFQSILITLSDHAKYEIGDSITVYKFTDRIRRLNEYVRSLEKQNKK